MEEVKKQEKEFLPLVPTPNKKGVRNKRRSEILFVLFMLLFPTIQFILFWIIPNAGSIALAFKNSRGDFTMKNFKAFFDLFKSKDTMQFRGNDSEALMISIRNSLIYFAINIFVCTPFVVFLSYVLFRKVPLNGAFKVIFYLPSIIGGTVMATLYFQLFRVKGPMFELLNKLGWLKGEAQNGLFGSSTAFLMVIIYSIWTCVGINMIMFYGAMRRIPQDIFESADIDGVGFFKQFFHIVVPLIWPTISTLIIFSLSGMFITYGPIMILAPDIKEASMIGWYIFSRVDNKNLNEPAAIGLLFTCVGLPFVLFVKWLLNKIGSNVEY